MTDTPLQAAFWPDPEPERSEPQRRTIAQIQAEGITSDVIKRLLRQRHADTYQWAFFDEFTPGIGYGTVGVSTRLDAWAMNVWPSGGYTTIAYEIKVSRGDFLREMKDAHKRDWALTFTDEFYFVAPRHLISVKELPENCGLVEVTKVDVRGSYEINGQQYNVRATKKPIDKRWGKMRDREQRPTWDLMAAVARRSCRAENTQAVTA